MKEFILVDNNTGKIIKSSSSLDKLKFIIKMTDDENLKIYQEL